MGIVIYGAQGIALGTYKAIKTLYPEKQVLCFLVTDMGNNAPTLGGIPVRELGAFVFGMSQEEKEHIEVWIATPENVMGVIEESLDEAGLYHHVRISSQRWADMMQSAFARTGEHLPLSVYPMGNHKPSLHVYKMIHCGDKALQTKVTDIEYVESLQVGAALTEERISRLTDHIGDNISSRNGNYSELTGLYWMWKNRLVEEQDSFHAYYGLAHYRRHLNLTEDDLFRLVDNDIDVVLPYPMPYEPNIGAHHERYLSDAEWQAVLTALAELQPEYAAAFSDVLELEYFYNYNVIIAKGNVLDDYCKWLFPLLFRIEEINDPDGSKKPNRYMGYVGETLETLYFMYHKEDLRIAHSGCKFLL